MPDPKETEGRSDGDWRVDEVVLGLGVPLIVARRDTADEREAEALGEAVD